MASITQGWVPGPNTRGTFDILKTCVQTIILCSWSSICVNVPAPDYGDFDLTRDKLHYALLNIFGPDFMFMVSFIQYQSARDSVERFKASGHEGWTISHGFYADMGGIHVRDPNWKSFPVNAHQLHYLVSRGYLPYPEIERREIKARGKLDGLSRIITLIQTLYFLISTLARVVQGLAITTLEVTVLGFIFCTLGTVFCWWRKPNDVETGHVFDLTTGIDQILREGGDAASEPFENTPLDFVAREQWQGYHLWVFYVRILRWMKLFPYQHKDRPLKRFSSFDYFPKPRLKFTELIVLSFVLVYSAIFFAAWRFHFPSSTECVMWRTFCIMQICGSFVVGLTEMEWSRSFARTAGGKAEKKEFSYFENAKVDVEHQKQYVSNSMISNWWHARVGIPIGRPPALSIPVRSLVISTPLCAAYCICRAFLLLEDMIGLRSVRSSVYTTVDWTQYFPSF